MDIFQIKQYIEISKQKEYYFNKELALLDKEILRMKKQKIKLGKMISKNMLHRNELIKQL